MKNNAKKKIFVLKRWVRVTIFFILSFFACLSIFLILVGLFPKQDLTPYYNYNVKRNIDYKVYLKPNNFYEGKYLEAGKQYTSELIDYVDIDLSYLFNGSNIINMNYDYDISATIIGEYENTSSGKSEIWTKKYKLLENQTKQVFDTTEFDINQNLKIKYDDYNKIVNAYKSQFKLAIDAYLNVKMNIKYDGKIQKNKKDIKGTDNLEINIPLSKTAIKIDTKYDEETSKNLIPTIDDLKDMKKVYTGLVILLIDILLLIKLFDKIFISKKTYYIKMLDKLLKDYSEIIVELSNPIDLNGLEILDIKNFDDMVDLEEELKSPILLYETIPNKESIFIVTNNNYAYVYTLNNENYNK